MPWIHVPCHSSVTAPAPDEYSSLCLFYISPGLIQLLRWEPLKIHCCSFSSVSFDYFRCLAFPYKLYNIFLHLQGILTEVILNLSIYEVGKNLHINHIWLFLALNVEWYSIYLELWFLSSVFCSFPHLDSVPILLNLYLSVSFFCILTSIFKFQILIVHCRHTGKQSIFCVPCILQHYYTFILVPRGFCLFVDCLRFCTVVQFS
jgi:hypothetical protein